MLALNGLVPLAVGIAIFILLWVVIFESLKKAGFFTGWAAVALVAMCVSLLSVIGMFRFLGAGDATYRASDRIRRDGPSADVILIPYAALGIAIIVLALYLFARKLRGSHKPEKSLPDGEGATEQVYQVNLGKGESPAQENLGEGFKERTTGRDNSRGPRLIDGPLGERTHQSDVRQETKSNRIKQ